MVKSARDLVSRDHDRKNGPWIITAYLGLLLFSCWLAIQNGFRFETNVTERFKGACIYQRESVECAQNEKLVHVLVVGDVMLGRGVDLERLPFRFTVGQIQAADISVANFEGAFADPRKASMPLPVDIWNSPYKFNCSPGRLADPAEFWIRPAFCGE